MRSVLLALVGVILATSVAVAQISVQVRIPKNDFLVYESLPVTVMIHNDTGRTIQLENVGEQPWLDFLVTTEANAVVAHAGRGIDTPSALIPPGETISHTIDLLPLFDLRSRGTYQVQANIRAAGISAISPVSRLSLMNGRQVWTQTVGLPAGDGEQEYCTYSLVTRREGSDEYLYASVVTEPRKTIYSLVSLGPLLPMDGPGAKVDKTGVLHVLFQNGPRSFGYAEISSRAKMSNRAAYADYMSRPELVEDGATVRVSGGEQTFPASEHILTKDELNPPPPPPPPKPKKKWWWPFGS